MTEVPDSVARRILEYRVAKREERANFKAYVDASTSGDEKLAKEHDDKRDLLSRNATTFKRRMLDAIDEWAGT